MTTSTVATADAAPAMRIVVLLRRLYHRPGKPDACLLGRCEQAALAAAVRLRDALGGTLTAVALGEAMHEEPTLAAALAAGCDRAVRVHAPACDDLDYLGTAEVLRAAVDRLGCDLLVCGDRSQDQGHGALGPAMAELLGMPHLTGVLDVDIQVEDRDIQVADGAAEPAEEAAEPAAEPAEPTRGGRAILARQRNGGRIHRFRCVPPVVLCIQGPMPAPDQPAPDQPATDQAPAAPIDHLSLDDLGLDARIIGHRGRLIGQLQTTHEGRRTVMATSPADLVTRLVADHVLR